jgi:hypothetical protein
VREWVIVCGVVCINVEGESRRIRADVEGLEKVN